MHWSTSNCLEVDRTPKSKIMRIDEFPSQIQEGLNSARKASLRAYAPYSSFFVGAAVVTNTGHIYHGQNQENAAYPLCLCAERVALSHYCSLTDDHISAICVYAENRTDSPEACAAPCGACRQVILEYSTRQNKLFPIYSMNQHGYVKAWENVYDLLPDAFKKEHL